MSGPAVPFNDVIVIDTIWYLHVRNRNLMLYNYVVYGGRGCEESKLDVVQLCCIWRPEM